jgi:hypothetical protein
MTTATMMAGTTRADMIEAGDRRVEVTDICVISPVVPSSCSPTSDRS